ncbi:hypothetical protein [Microbispora bryophytorum]|uniref:hypothetical protein n=1 Tax=Microbispora bryophytorum TaxID=1460882 RepID=UPI00115BA8A0|nr:hypothetical protein [Microbispora bryophytorum]MBD3135935.1 hypothetical protein [Microbispora bryophytorum]TQS07705.1 hypothetical protein FLX07_07695 [Microbispora bryophytorum]
MTRLLLVFVSGRLPRVDALAFRLLPGRRSRAVRGLRRHRAVTRAGSGAGTGSGIRLTGRGQAEGLVAGAARRGKVPGVPRYSGVPGHARIPGHVGIPGHTGVFR